MLVGRPDYLSSLEPCSLERRCFSDGGPKVRIHIPLNLTQTTRERSSSAHGEPRQFHFCAARRADQNFRDVHYDHPALADGFDFAEDAKSATFKLRPGVEFHDGSPVTPDDVKWSYEHYRGAWGEVLHKNTDAVEIVDDHSVRFHFKEPFFDFPILLGTGNVCGAGWMVPILFSLGFRFGDSFALPLEHQFTLEAGDSADDGEDQVTGRCAGIAEIQDAEVGPLGFHAFGDFEQMPCRTRERAGNDCSMIGEELCRPRKQWRTV